MIWLLRKINLCIKTSSNGYVISVIVKSHEIAPKEHSTLKVSFSIKYLITEKVYLVFNVKFTAVVSGGDGGALAPPEFGSSVNPIPTRGGRLCPPHYC